MDQTLFAKISLESSRKLSSISEFSETRDVYETIKPPTDYFVGIKGLRGIGKTTLLLQLSRRYKNPLYFSADAIYLRNETIYDIISYAAKNGHDSFFIDEIHYQKNWTYSLKTLHDEGARNIFFTGSSAIELRKGADLSRRAILIDLPPATFREFLAIKKKINLKGFSLQELISQKKEILPNYSQTFSYFEEYLNYGGMLYDRQEFDLKLSNSLTKLATIDLAYLRDVNMNIENDVFRIFQLVSTTSSFETNYSRLASMLSISKSTAIKLVTDLSNAGGITICLPYKKGYSLVRNEPKLFLPIPISAFFSRQLGILPNVGRAREEFFISHVRTAAYLKTERGVKTSDFVLNDKTFEIGGVSKKSAQNPDYLVIDGLDISENRIPLILFGFLHYVQ